MIEDLSSQLKSSNIPQSLWSAQEINNIHFVNQMNCKIRTLRVCGMFVQQLFLHVIPACQENRKRKHRIKQIYTENLWKLSLHELCYQYGAICSDLLEHLLQSDLLIYGNKTCMACKTEQICYHRYRLTQSC